MKIEKLGIRAFGKFHERTWHFADGASLIYGVNEAGKSTMASFMLYMFYGMPPARSAKDKALRARYIPWGEAEASGYLDLSDGDRRYRIERSGDKKCALIDLSTGRQIRLTRGISPGEYFFGVGEKSFLASVFVRQSELAVGENAKDLEEISQRLKNLVSAGEESVSVPGSIKLLSEARKEIENARRQGRLEQANSAYFALLEQRSKAKADREEVAALRREAGQLAQKRDHIASLLEQYKQARAKQSLTEVSERYQAYREFKAQVDKLDAQIKALDAQYHFDAFDPAHSEADLARAQQMLAQAKALDTRLREQELEGERLERLLEQQTPESPGDTKAAALYAACTAVRRPTPAIWIGVGISALIALAALAWLIAGEIAPLPLALALAGAAVSGGLTLWYRRRQRENDPDVLCRRHGYRDFADLKAQLAADQAAACRYEQLRGALDVHKKDYAAQRAQLKERRDNVQALLAPYGLTDQDLPAAAQYLAAAGAALEKRAAYQESRRLLAAQCAKKRGDLSEKELAERAQAAAKTSARAAAFARAHAGPGVRPAPPCGARAFLPELEVKRLEQSLLTVSMRLSALSERIHALDEARVSTRLLGDLIRAKRAQIDQLELNRDALDAAIAAIEQSEEVLAGRFSPQLKQRAQEYFSTITGGLRPLYLESLDQVRLEQDGSIHQLDAFSAGTIDALYLSLRLALVDTLFPKTKPPLILDDSFSRMDEQRLARLLALATAKKEEQVFLFTCSKTLAQSLTGKIPVITLDESSAD